MNIPYKKLDEKIKELNSTRVFKKVTLKDGLFGLGWLCKSGTLEH